MTRKKRFIWAALGLVTVILVTGVAIDSQRRPVQLVPGPQPGQLTPAYSALTFRGDSVSLASFRGNVVLLNFWATWCKPCVAEIPTLKDLHDRYKESGLSVVAVSLDKNRKTAQRFVRDYRLPWRNLIDRDARVMAVFSVSKGVPKSLLIDRDGTVRSFWYGAVDSAKAFLVSEAVAAGPLHPLP